MNDDHRFSLQRCQLLGADAQIRPNRPYVKSRDSSALHDGMLAGERAALSQIRQKLG